MRGLICQLLYGLTLLPGAALAQAEPQLDGIFQRTHSPHQFKITFVHRVKNGANPEYPFIRNKTALEDGATEAVAWSDTMAAGGLRLYRTADLSQKARATRAQLSMGSSISDRRKSSSAGKTTETVEIVVIGRWKIASVPRSRLENSRSNAAGEISSDGGAGELNRYARPKLLSLETTQTALVPRPVRGGVLSR